MNIHNIIDKQRIEMTPDSLTLLRLESCDSTNSFLRRHLKELAKQFPVGISSGSQLKGRGRDSRSWFSLPGKGLYVSLGFYLNSPENLNLLSLIAGISIAETLQGITDRDFKLKWPNDVLYQGKKIAGTLIENIINKNSITCICGMGININHNRSDFRGRLRQSATSIKCINGQSRVLRDIEPLLIRSFFNWQHRLEEGDKSSVINTFREMNHHKIGEEITFNNKGQSIKGHYIQVNINGGIEIRLPDGKKKIYFSGEIDSGR